jgi:hypothetical protein
MVQLLRLLCGALIGLFRSSVRLEAEILVLRQQSNVLRRKSPNRPALNNADRLLFVWLSRLTKHKRMTPVAALTWIQALVRDTQTRPESGTWLPCPILI